MLTSDAQWKIKPALRALSSSLLFSAFATGCVTGSGAPPTGRGGGGQDGGANQPIGNDDDINRDCSLSSVGLIPLTDFTTQRYFSETGGLYPGESNEPPESHAALGAQLIERIEPLDADGEPDERGVIVLASVGMSNASQEFTVFIENIESDVRLRRRLRLVNLAIGGADTEVISDFNSSYWPSSLDRLTDNGFTPAQVQVVWLKNVIARPTGSFDEFVGALTDDLHSIVLNLQATYPNLQAVFMSSRTYGGYSGVKPLSPEPYAYESAFAVRRLIQRQIDGDPELVAGEKAPWLGWGPYLWTDGFTGRADGLKWLCEDVVEDGVHPSETGKQKVAELLERFFTTNPLATPWFLGE